MLDFQENSHHTVKKIMTDILTGMYLLGRPLSPFYSLLMKLRTSLYTKGLWKSEKMKVPVISVGNLTMGGTGKTPFVRYIAKLLAQNNFKPAIISRGYGGKSRKDLNIVSDGKTVLMDAVQAGDEPVLLAQSLPGIPVVTGKVRSIPCNYAITHLKCDILILDDGFQHLQVARDTDLVLFSAASPLGNNRVFPGGDLREPLSALSRAQAFVMTGSNESLHPRTEEFSRFLQKNFPQRPVFLSSYSPLEFRNREGHTPTTLSDIPAPVYGFCGIANPCRFYETLKNCGFTVDGFTALKDHQTYDRHLTEKISRMAKAKNAKALITTEKDMVKLRPYSFPLPVYSITMSVDIEETFSDFLLNKFAVKIN